MRHKLPYAMLLSLLVSPPALWAQDQQQSPPSKQQQPDKPQPQPQAPPKLGPPPSAPASSPTNTDPATDTWKAEDVPFPPWTLQLAVAGKSVKGVVSQGAIDRIGGMRTDETGPVGIYEGAFDGTTISFKCISPDGDRTVSFSGKISGDEIAFTRDVIVRVGGDRGKNGIFDASGPRSFTAKRESGHDSHDAAGQPPEDKPVLKPTQPPAKASNTTADPSSGSGPNYDPFHAAQDVDVGTFYMHKGDIDAAIDRFKDAIRLKPNFAKPRLLLGDLYAKKGDKTQAIRYYKEFLEIMPPGSPDTKRVQKQIEKLSQK